MEKRRKTLLKTKTKNPLLIFLIFLILTSSLLPIIVYASDSDQDGIDDEKEINETRSLKILQLPSLVGIESETEVGNTENEWGFLITTFLGPKLLFRYSSELETSDVETEFKIFYYIAFREIIEYEPLTDTPLQTLNLRTASYDNIILVTATSTDGESGYKVELSSSDAIFKIRAYIFNTYALVNGALVNPNSVKVEIEINNFPYFSQTSVLKLDALVISKTKIEDGDNEVKTYSGNVESYFQWEKEVSSDGIKKPITYNKISEVAYTESLPISFSETNLSVKLIELTYPHSTIILHDPILSTIPATTIPIEWLLIAIVIITAVSYFAFIKRKRRSQK